MASSPPKPWERAGASSSPLPVPLSAGANNAFSASSATTAAPPPVPQRPSAMAGTSSMMPSSLGVNSSYSQPYRSFGGYGQSYGQGYSSYNGYANPSSAYGNAYSPYSSSRFSSPYMSNAYNRPYGQSYGMNANGNGPMMGQMESSTAATFALLDSVVQSFGSFAAMLDSTFHAVFQSFNAMMGAAEQFTSLRVYLSEMLNIFVMAKGLKTWLKWMLASKSELETRSTTDLVNEFKSSSTSQNASALATAGQLAHPQSIRKKPILIFFAVVFGLPYLVSKLVKLLSRNMSPQQLQQQQQHQLQMQLQQGEISLDPNNIELVRALYDFSSSNPIELSFKRGDIIAVLQKMDIVTGQLSPWWSGKLEKGPVGWFPANYVENIRRPANAAVLTPIAFIQPTPSLPTENIADISATAFLESTDMPLPDAASAPL